MTNLLLRATDYLVNAQGNRYCLDAVLAKELDDSLISHLEEIAIERRWRTGRVFAPWDPKKEKSLLTISPSSADNHSHADQFFAVECGVPTSISALTKQQMGESEPIPVAYSVLHYVDGEYCGVIADFVRSGEDEYIPAIWAKICINIIDAYWIAGDTSGLN
jgi:hypothetical protein